jgi:hypothetical protein
LKGLIFLYKAADILGEYIYTRIPDEKLLFVKEQLKSALEADPACFNDVLALLHRHRDNPNLFDLNAGELQEFTCDGSFPDAQSGTDSIVIIRKPASIVGSTDSLFVDAKYDLRIAPNPLRTKPLFVLIPKGTVLYTKDAGQSPVICQETSVFIDCHGAAPGHVGVFTLRISGPPRGSSRSFSFTNKSDGRFALNEYMTLFRIIDSLPHPSRSLRSLQQFAFWKLAGNLNVADFKRFLIGRKQEIVQAIRSDRDIAKFLSSGEINQIALNQIDAYSSYIDKAADDLIHGRGYREFVTKEDPESKEVVEPGPSLWDNMFPDPPPVPNWTPDFP